MNLDDQKIYKKLDKHLVGKSIECLPSQIKQVLEDLKNLKIPKEYSQVSRVVVNGMGGSSLGAYMIKSMFTESLKVPFAVESGYVLPKYVNKDTLYIIVSYSGTTEEPISTYQEAKKRGAKISAILENNPNSALYKLVKKDNIPAYIFNPKNNPSNQPRLGVGYTVFGIIALIMRAKLISIKSQEIIDHVAYLNKNSEKLKADISSKNNNAKKIAIAMQNRIPILTGAEHITGNLHAMRNQINECAKQFSCYLVLPDLNHYAMEGLVMPKTNKDNLIFFFIDSKLYHPRVQLRAKLTKQVVQKNKIKTISFELKAKNKLGQALETLQLGSWISYYLGMLNSVDPVKIPWVDWFKKELK